VELCAQTCDQVLGDASASLQVHFGCATISNEVPE
jgi:hypothetical protein